MKASTSTSELRPEEIEAVVEKLGEINRALKRFQADVQLAEREPDSGHGGVPFWLAAYSGAVVAREDSLESLIRRLDEMGIPSAEAACRFVEADPPALILWC